ncbi:SMP-30/gluconolactonase/LRE family protein, partial [candidate division KSB1 bacterium]|nr:SMP-30/gluconolactonase/LRE family protein [candidate division KSB1 bacterium]
GGRAYVGNFGYDRHRGEPLRSACIARVDPDGSVSVAAEDLIFPNGTVITPDGKTLIVAEMRGHRLTAFDVMPDASLANRRSFAELEDCLPDGICLDDLTAAECAAQSGETQGESSFCEPGCRGEACSSPPEGNVCCPDSDSDGVTTCDGDCDDGDPTVFPGAPELCDGVDNNCDGAVDPLDSGFVLARFGCSVGTGDSTCDAADQNGDGAVDPF